MEGSPEDWYGALGVQRDFTPEQIEKAYADKVTLHSKKNGGNMDEADTEMKAVNAAYRILKDSEKRAEYDRKLDSAAPSGGSEQTFPSPGRLLREPEKDGGPSEVGLGVSEKEVGIPSSLSVAVDDVVVAVPVGEIQVEPEDQAPGARILPLTTAEHMDLEESYLVRGRDAERVPQVNVHVSDSTTILELEWVRIPDDVPDNLPADSERVTDAKLSKDRNQLWKNAIEQKDPAMLLSLFKQNASNFWEFERKDRTALHVAAMGDDFNNRALAKLILDQLLEVEQRKYTKRIFKAAGGYLNITLDQYIEAIEKKSRKTAMELAKENSEEFEFSKYIAEYIIDTQRRSKEHDEIERAVDVRNNLDSRETAIFSSSIRIGSFELQQNFFCNLVGSRDCNFLLMCFEKNPSLELWRSKDGSGRTVLHVAAIQGCFPLAKKILDVVRDVNDRDYVRAVDSQSNLTALQMADDIIGNKSITQYIKFTMKRMENEDYDHPCFFEAYPHTAWYKALATGDYLMLRRLINHRLLFETYKGLTVLHVAIIHQHLNLVEVVLELFGDKREIVLDESLIFPSRLTWEQMFEKEITCDADMINVSVQASQFSMTKKNEDSISAPQGLWRKEPFKGSAMKLARFIEQDDDSKSAPYMSEILNALEAYDKLNDWAKTSDFFSTTASIKCLEDLINKHWNKDWDLGFEADVDFNFEQDIRYSLFRLHYACKYPRIFRHFIRSVTHSSSFRTRGMSFLLKHMRDGQGRTIYHILLDHHNKEDQCIPGQWIFNEAQSLFDIDAKDLNTCVYDSRGRNACDIMLTKNYLQHDFLLKNMLVKIGDDENDNGYLDYSPINNDDYDICFAFYFIAKVLKQTNVSQLLWSNILQKDMPKFKLRLCEFKPILYVAASIGDQEILNILLEDKCVDFTSIDENGRTTLHHAANPTLLEFKTLMMCPWVKHCFSTVKDVCDFQQKWNEEKKTPSMIFPKSNVENLINVEREKLVNMEREKLVYVGRMACILMLVQAGVDLSQEDIYKKLPTIGATNDADYQKWWYNLVVQDTTDKNNSFNQAAGALSVVGTLVAATSYIGPLQPPMTYNDNGYVRIGEKLIAMFMVSNTLAFYFAMASVTVAVVPALPMRRESVLSELKRAEQTVAFSLGLLLFSILFIIISFASASMVVIEDQHSFHGSYMLLFPSIIGWILCLIAIISFLRRMMRLIFYDKPIIRQIYTFSISTLCKEIGLKCCEKVCSVKDTYWRSPRAITPPPTLSATWTPKRASSSASSPASTPKSDPSTVLDTPSHELCLPEADEDLIQELE